MITLDGHTHWINAVNIISNESTHDPNVSIIRIVSGSYDETIIFWDIRNENNTILTLIDQQKINELSLVFTLLVIPSEKITFLESKRENCVICATSDNTITAWNIKTKRCDFVIESHTTRIGCIKLLPDGRIISGSNGILKIWNTSSRYDTPYICDLSLEGHKSYVNDVIILSDGRIVSCSDDQTIKIWI
jgi:WD40 repeat protein